MNTVESVKTSRVALSLVREFALRCEIVSQRIIEDGHRLSAHELRALVDRAHRYSGDAIWLAREEARRAVAP